MSGNILFIGFFLLATAGQTSSLPAEIIPRMVFEQRTEQLITKTTHISDNLSAIGQWAQYFFLSSKEESLKDPSLLIANAPEKLSVWTYGISPDSFRWSLESFQKRFPKTTVDTRFIANEKDYLDLLSSSFRQGTPPDIFLVSSTWFSEYASLFVDAPEGFFSSEECHTVFFPFSCDAFERNGVMKGVPLFLDAPFLIVNRALLADDRVAVAGKPETNWRGFLENRENFLKYTAKNNMTFASFPLQEDSPLFSLFLFSLLAQAEADAEDIHESGLEIFQLLDVITKTEKTQNRVKQDAEESFLEGKTAILIGTNENLQNILTELENTTKPKIEKANILALPLPQLDPKNPIIMGETRGLVISRRSTHPTEAWALALFLAFQENQSFVIRQDGLFSARNDLFSEHELQALLSGAQNLPDTVLNLAFRKQLLENGVRFLSGEISAQEATDNVLSSLLETP